MCGCHKWRSVHPSMIGMQGACVPHICTDEGTPLSQLISYSSMYCSCIGRQTPDASIGSNLVCSSMLCSV